MPAFEEFLKHMLRRGVELGADEGLKKLSDLTGSKAKQVGAATEVANKFLSALKNETFEEANICLDRGLLKKLEAEGGLGSYFFNFNFATITWSFTAVDDSSKSNRWGNVVDVWLAGNIEYQAVGSAQVFKENFRLQMVKEWRGWKVNSLDFTVFISKPNQT